MSDYYNQNLSTARDSHKSRLHICLFSFHSKLTQSILELLNGDLYYVENISASEDLLNILSNKEKHLDCIILVKETRASSILEELWQSQVLLPTVIIEADKSTQLAEAIDLNSNEDIAKLTQVSPVYHEAEIRLYPIQLSEIKNYINLAITKFLSLLPSGETPVSDSAVAPDGEQVSLIVRQRRLTEKIKERLGYLGVYYKRQANHFYRNLPAPKQEKLYLELSQSYRKILIEYFSDSSQINKLIDEFVDRAFFADVSTSQILEIHMELIDDFSHQLQIEGRNDDILLDYRLPLIDIIAHLCEMYRRSIPGDDTSLDLLFTVK